MQDDDEARLLEGGRGKRAAEKGAARQAKRARLLEAAQGKPRRQAGPRSHDCVQSHRAPTQESACHGRGRIFLGP